MTEPIKAALTPEEWERELRGRAYRTDKGIPSSPFNRYEITDYPEHALAALALYGQPFGFTREDVRIIRKYADAKQADLEWTLAHPPHTDDWHRAISEAGMEPKTLFDALIDREVGPWRSLADRIESLLPPEKPPT